MPQVAWAPWRARTFSRWRSRHSGSTTETPSAPRANSVLELSIGIPELSLIDRVPSTQLHPAYSETKGLFGVLGALVVSRAVGQEQASGQRQPIIDPNLSKITSAARTAPFG